MSKTAFLFPGQGAQKAGMGKDFYEQSEAAREVYDQASLALALDMKELCFAENDKLDITEYTQVALVTTCLAMAKEIMRKGLIPDVTAGLSLGEYPAIVIAGGMSGQEAVTTVRKRGQLMQEAVPAGEGAMAAILGMTGEAIEEVLEDLKDVSIANYNCPGQIVITGKAAAVEQAMAKLKEQGAKRTVLLKVSGPFHSPFMEPAGQQLKEVLDGVAFQKLRIPYVSNVTADFITDSTEIKQLLTAQVASSVRWQQSVETMIKDGVDTFVEIGPGKTLTGFLKKISKDVNMYNIETIEDMDKVIGELVCWKEK